MINIYLNGNKVGNKFYFTPAKAFFFYIYLYFFFLLKKGNIEIEKLKIEKFLWIKTSSGTSKLRNF